MDMAGCTGESRSAIDRAVSATAVLSGLKSCRSYSALSARAADAVGIAWQFFYDCEDGRAGDLQKELEVLFNTPNLRRSVSSRDRANFAAPICAKSPEARPGHYVWNSAQLKGFALV
jgi:hypothetical protein